MTRATTLALGVILLASGCARREIVWRELTPIEVRTTDGLTDAAPRVASLQTGDDNVAIDLRVGPADAQIAALVVFPDGLDVLVDNRNYNSAPRAEVRQLGPEGWRPLATRSVSLAIVRDSTQMTLATDEVDEWQDLVELAVTIELANQERVEVRLRYERRVRITRPSDDDDDDGDWYDDC